MIKDFYAYALEWWVRKQGKFDGASICTSQLKDGSFVITEWKVSGIDKPNEKEIKSIMTQYDDANRPLDKKK